MNKPAYVHLHIPAATKGRWVRASRAARMRLTDYITQAVEAYMQQQITNVTIPDSISFADLKLSRTKEGSITFDWSPIEAICAASDIPVEILKEGPEDNVAALLVTWYGAHKQHGGDPDPVAEDLLAEVMAEDSAGQNTSHKPGTA